MIIYDGAALESVAPVRIEDIRVNPIEQSAINRPRAVYSGSEFVRMRYGTRTVAITFAVQREDRTNRQAALLAISEWAKSDKEYRLELPLSAVNYLQCVCTGKPEPSFRQWWEAKLRLVFTCYDNPFWTSKEEKTVACGSEFYVLGSAPPLMQITRTLGSAASNQAYSDGTDTMTFSTVPVGDMVIDLNHQTASVTASGTTSSIMQYYTAASSFVIPHTGRQTITGTGTVKYRERWQ